MVDLAVGSEVPETDEMIAASEGDEALAVGGDRKAHDPACMGLETAALVAGCRVPKVNFAVVPSTSNERLAVRSKSNASASWEGMQLFARGCFPEADAVVGAASRQCPAIRRKRHGAESPLRSFAGYQRLAGRHFPEPDSVVIQAPRGQLLAVG